MRLIFCIFFCSTLVAKGPFDFIWPKSKSKYAISHDNKAYAAQAVKNWGASLDTRSGRISSTFDFDPHLGDDVPVALMGGQLASVHHVELTKGASPITLSMSYLSGEKSNWSIFPEIYLRVLEGEHPTKSRYFKIEFNDSDGAKYQFRTKTSTRLKRGNQLQFLNVEGNRSNMGGGFVSGRSNPWNTKVLFDHEKLFVHFPDGRVRFYMPMTKYKKKVYYFLNRETLPNGHKRDFIYDEYGRVEKIKALAADDSPVGYANFYYMEDDTSFRVVNHANENFYFQATPYKIKKRTFFSKRIKKKYCFSRIDSGYMPAIQYIINFGEDHRPKSIDRLQIGNLSTNFEYKNDKVSAILTGDRAKYRFIYNKTGDFNTTEVIDAVGRSDIHIFETKTGDLRRINHQAYPGKDLFIERLFWSTNTFQKRLLGKVYESEGSTHSGRYFVYDDRMNVTEDHLLGNITGEKTAPYQLSVGSMRTTTETDHKIVRYTYNADNLMTSKTYPDGTKEQYHYRPNTDLVTAIIHLTKEGRVCKRNLYRYDSGHFLSEEIEDDADERDPTQLPACNFRKHTVYHNHKTFPAVGMAEWVEEYGNGVLIGKKRLEYDSCCQVIREEIYNARGEYSHTIHRTYDRRARLVSQTDALGRTKNYRYNNDNKCTSIKDCATGVETLFQYDKFGRQIAKSEKIGRLSRAEHYSYDARDRRIQTIDEFGNATTVTYNHLDKPTKITQPRIAEFGAPTATINYDLCGNITETQDPSGALSKMRHTIMGKPYEVIDAAGGVTKNTYDFEGRLIESIDPEGRITKITYDALGRPTHKTQAGLEEKWVYNGLLLASHTTPDGLTTHYRYDHAGRKIEERVRERITRYSYDSLGNLQDIITDSHIRYTYDLAGRKVSEELVENGQPISCKRYHYSSNDKIEMVQIDTDSGPSITRTDYDKFDRPIRQTDPLGYQTHIEYRKVRNSLDQLVEECMTTAPNGNRTITTFDAAGNLASKQIYSLTDQLVQHEEFRYDGMKRKVRQISHIIGPVPRTQHTRWQYDSRGNLILLSEDDKGPNTKQTHRTYNRDNTLATIIKPDGTTLHYSYTQLKKVARLHSSDATIDYTYTYNQYGLPIQVTDARHKRKSTRTYDAYGNIIEETLANGYTIIREYTPHGKVARLLLPQTTINYTYKNGRLTQIQSDDITHGYSYDTSGAVLSETLPYNLGDIHHQQNLAGQNITLATEYHTHTHTQIDPMGNILSTTLDDQTRTYSYDALSQITTENATTYTYDSHNNRLTKDATTYTYNSLSQLTSRYQYDANGNPIAKDNITYSYDALDRLIAITSGEHTLTYSYDPWHRRLTKTLHGKTTSYLYDGDNEIGTPEQYRILGIGLGAEIGATIAIVSDSHTLIPLHDLHGNIIHLLSPQGETLETYTYDAFGLTTPSGLSPYRYQSKRLDPETHLTHFGRRYYDPAAGRFLTPDPKGLTDINPYTFVLNNPLTILDLYGLENTLPAGVRLLTTPTTDFDRDNGRFPPFSEIRKGGLFCRDNTNIFEYCSNRKIVSPNVILVQGMQNTRDDAHKIGARMRNHLGMNVSVLQPDHRGFVYNLTRCYAEKFGIPTRGINQFMDLVNSSYDGGCRDFRVFAHSEGTLMVKLAMRNIRQEVKDCCRIIGFGNATMLNRSLGRYVFNYLSIGEKLVHTVDPLSFAQAIFEGNVKMLHPEKKSIGSYIWDHSLNGTYMKPLFTELELIKEDYNLEEHSDSFSSDAF
ncbi:MAG: hypothetical protein MRY21_00400 [Simkaniaceae bacterium]|nr:hypothetical protein [Simkaniaceae bacterium]